MSNELVTTNGGFDSLAIADTEAGTLANVAREESELKAAIFLARNFPRDEAKAYARLVRSCERPSFASGAQYCFPRGGQDVKGPSIDLAREAARCWGNIRYGLRIVTLDEENVHIKGYAIDLESNTYAETEDKFARLIFRKKGGWVKPDERDLRELVNRRGAICVRNAILQVLPPDVIDAACKQSDDTLKKSARGELEQHRDDTLKTLAVAFDRLGISTEMLVKFLGHDLKLITAEELTNLRQVYKSIADGNSKPGDSFDYGDGAPQTGEKTEELKEKLRAAREKKGDKNAQGGTHPVVTPEAPEPETKTAEPPQEPEKTAKAEKPQKPPKAEEPRLEGIKGEIHGPVIIDVDELKKYRIKSGSSRWGSMPIGSIPEADLRDLAMTEGEWDLLTPSDQGAVEEVLKAIHTK